MAKFRNKFAGADDIYLTKNSIAVRRVSTYRTRKGEQVYSDKTKYFKRTKNNLIQASSLYGRLRFGR